MTTPSQIAVEYAKLLVEDLFCEDCSNLPPEEECAHRIQQAIEQPLQECVDNFLTKHGDKLK